MWPATPLLLPLLLPKLPSSVVELGAQQQPTSCARPTLHGTLSCEHPSAASLAIAMWTCRGRACVCLSHTTQV
jgi:hypothetical protein